MTHRLVTLRLRQHSYFLLCHIQSEVVMCKPSTHFYNLVKGTPFQHHYWGIPETPTTTGPSSHLGQDIQPHLDLFHLRHMASFLVLGNQVWPTPILTTRSKMETPCIVRSWALDSDTEPLTQIP